MIASFADWLAEPKIHAAIVDAVAFAAGTLITGLAGLLVAVSKKIGNYRKVVAATAHVIEVAASDNPSVANTGDAIKDALRVALPQGTGPGDILHAAAKVAEVQVGTMVPVKP